MQERHTPPALLADASSLCDSGAHAPHPWGVADQGLAFEDSSWHADPWQNMDADYRRWQQARYLQLADEFERTDRS
jgi:hypothetical protein